MLFIFGNKHDTDFVGQVPARCPRCGSSPTYLAAQKEKLTVYFIPTFSLNTRYVLGCSHCQDWWAIDREQGDRLRASARPAPPPTWGQAPPASFVTSRCSRCGTAAAPGARFCQNCGAALGPPDRCPGCGHLHPAGQFCSQCGTSLGG